MKFTKRLMIVIIISMLLLALGCSTTSSNVKKEEKEEVILPKDDSLLSKTYMYNSLSDFKKVDDIWYLLDSGAYLHSMKIEDNNLKFLDKVPESLFMYEGEALQIKGNYAFVSSSVKSELRVYDISNPNNISMKHKIDLYDYGYDMVIKGNYIFIATSYAGLSIYRINEITDIEFLGRYRLGNTFRLKVIDNFLLVYAQNGNVVYDISNPEDMKVVDNSEMKKIAKAYFINDKYAYLTSDGLIEVYNIQDITKPKKLFSYSGNKKWVESVYIEKNIMVYSSDKDGVVVCDISDVNNIVKIKSFYCTNRQRVGKFFKDGNNFVVYADKNLFVYDYAQMIQPNEQESTIEESLDNSQNSEE